MELALRSITRRYGDAEALVELDGRFSGGEIWAVLGPNGAGKSTLLSVIRGETPVTSGRIELDGRLVKPNRLALRRESFLLRPDVTIEMPLEWVGRMVDEYQVDRPGLVDEAVGWFERFGLFDAIGVSGGGLSRGQRFKVDMIALFVVRPRLWLLDEPFAAGLDAEGLTVLRDEARRHAAGGGLVVFTDQWPNHAVDFATHALVLHRGRAVHRGAVGDPIDALHRSDVDDALRPVLDGLTRHAR